MLLLLADRVDVVEHRLDGVMAGPLHRAGLAGTGDCVRRQPLSIMAGVALGVWFAAKLLR